MAQELVLTSVLLSCFIKCIYDWIDKHSGPFDWIDKHPGPFDWIDKHPGP